MANLTKEIIFPTPVYQIFLDDHELLNVYLKSRLYSWRQRDRSGPIRSNGGQMGVWQSVNTMHEMREFELLNNQIRNCMAALLADQKNTLPGNLWCTAMCAQISDRFGYDQPLPEAGIGWQGIYFVHTPMDSGAIIFQNPRTHAMSNVNCTTQGISANGFGNENETVFDAIAGRVLLFPSWLGYRVQANKSQQKGEEGDRICIRFAFSMSEK